MTPVSSSERHYSMDVVRGVALLGILLMNILDFGLPDAAYSNLNVAGGSTGANLGVFFVQYIFFEGKMRALFSLMFGAGIVLLTTRGIERGGGIEVADIYYRRALWMVLFGLLHAYLIWVGDILYYYAICGLFLFPLRKLGPRAMLTVAGIMFLVLAGAQIGEGFQLREKRTKGVQAQELEKKGGKLNDDQKKAKEEWEKAVKEHHPPSEELNKEIEAHRGGYFSVFKRRASELMKWHSMPLYLPVFFDFYMMMLIGMAFLKMGVITGERAMGFYAKLAIAGYLTGLPVNAITSWLALQSNFGLMDAPFIYSTYQLGRVSVALAHMAVLVMIVKAGALKWLTRRLAAVGQTALSNYISHSILAGIVFYGYGLGLYAKLERYQLYMVVPILWIWSLVWSPIWLRHFRFGPLEWCWRSLTYWTRQPMRLRAIDPPTVAVAAATAAEPE